MVSYRFDLILAGEWTDAEALEALADQLYAATTDGSLIVRRGQAEVWWECEASSLADAVASAVAEVEKVGFHVVAIKTQESEQVESINAQLKQHQPTEALHLESSQPA